MSDATHLVRARADAIAGGAVSRGSAISAWLPIIYGCDKTCTYCIVPFSRGPERSRPFDEIVDEARALGAAGYREVTLLGQNVNSYGHDLAPEPRFAHVHTERTVGRHQDRDARPDLAELIRAIDALRTADGAPAIPRLRFVTSHPWDLSDRLIDALRDCPSVCEALHLPVQSGSDSMLRRMGRQYTIEHYLERLGGDPRRQSRASRCRRTSSSASAARPRPSTRRRSGCSRPSATTRSSPRRTASGPGTPATRMTDDVPAAEKRRRLNELLGAPGGDRARAQPGLGRARDRGPRRHRRPAAQPRPRRRGCRGHRRSRATRSRTCPTASPTWRAARARTSSSTWRARRSLVGELVRVRVEHAGPYALRGTLA